MQLAELPEGKGIKKMIRLVGKRGKGSFESQLDDAAKGFEFVQIDCTSESPDLVMREGCPHFILVLLNVMMGYSPKRLSWLGSAQSFIPIL